MQGRSWPTLVLLAAIGACGVTLLLVCRAPSAQAQASEGTDGRVIAIATPLGRESLLYLIDTSREVVLVYGYHYPGSGAVSRDLRTGAFEFLAGRLYHWDALLSSRREYSIKGVQGIHKLQGLRPAGPQNSSEAEYNRLQER